MESSLLEVSVRFVLPLLIFAAGTLATVSAAQAQNYPWCANFADGAGVNCGFSTYEQCMATSQGSGGYCTKNNLYVPPHTMAPARRTARKHRLRQNF
jgi:hypothetical protein